MAEAMSVGIRRRIARLRKEHRYRKGSTNEAANCQYCKHFGRDLAGDAVFLAGCPGTCTLHEIPARSDYRCNSQVTTYKPPNIFARRAKI